MKELNKLSLLNKVLLSATMLTFVYSYISLRIDVNSAIHGNNQTHYYFKGLKIISWVLLFVTFISILLQFKNSENTEHKSILKYIGRQAVYGIIALILILLPFFIDKGNMKTHYLFSLLAFTLLLRNLISTKTKTIPIILMIVGLFFIFGYIYRAKSVSANSEKRKQELINSIK